MLRHILEIHALEDNNVEHGNLGATGIVRENIPVVVVAGLSQELQGNEKVVICFFGDGASTALLAPLKKNASLISEELCAI
jgi:hypothetical protein